MLSFNKPERPPEVAVYETYDGYAIKLEAENKYLCSRRTHTLLLGGRETYVEHVVISSNGLMQMKYWSYSRYNRLTFSRYDDAVKEALRLEKIEREKYDKRIAAAKEARNRAAFVEKKVWR